MSWRFAALRRDDRDGRINEMNGRRGNAETLLEQPTASACRIAPSVWETVRLRRNRICLDAKIEGENSRRRRFSGGNTRQQPLGFLAQCLRWVLRGEDCGRSLRDLDAFLQEQKRGVPRLHGNMLPGNSFPQICVVSGTMIAGNVKITQEYLCAMTQSNLLYTT
jgi:hypothetical protein